MSEGDKHSSVPDKKTDAIMALLASVSVLVTSLRKKEILTDDELETMEEALLNKFGEDEGLGETYDTFIRMVFKRRHQGPGAAP